MSETGKITLGILLYNIVFSVFIALLFCIFEATGVRIVIACAGAAAWIHGIKKLVDALEEERTLSHISGTCETPEEVNALAEEKDKDQ